MAQNLISIGNTAAEASGGRYDWVFYVRGATQCIDHVTVKLHPTFKNPVRRSSGPAFEFASNGWGTFVIDVVIAWKSGGELMTEWDLQFKKLNGSRDLPIPPEVVAAAEAPQEKPSHRLPASVESAGSSDMDVGPDPAELYSAVGRPAGFTLAQRLLEEDAALDPPSFDVEAQRELVASQRPALSSLLSEVGFLSHSHELFMHGRAYQGPKTPPQCAWRSVEAPRDDHGAPEWLTASEFEDDGEVMKVKCQQLALMMRLSVKTVAYTGAGISAAVIGQAARSGQNTVGWKGDTRTAKPTFTHHALGFLGQAGLINSWVQQNHDGLPQKAGFPQENINEIHGSWYDPSNPVVKYSGSLHDRAFPWMQNDANTADLVLVLGTSMGGLNADQVATKTAGRSRSGQALGSVMMNLQQTEQDGKMSLRFFGKSDDILRLLLVELGFGALRLGLPVWPRESRVLVPYAADGSRAERRMWLDLRDGQRVRLTPGHNIQGAQQPMYMHIGGTRPTTCNGRTFQPGPGVGHVVRRCESSSSFVLQIESVEMRLGIWWLETAAHGRADHLPLVNEVPSFE